MTFVQAGATVVQAPAQPEVKLAATPLMLLPPPFDDLLDRVEARSELAQAIAARVPSELSGPAGIGKSALLRYAGRQVDISSFGSRVVYVEQRQQPADDLLQYLFEIFYDGPANLTPVPGKLQRYLHDVQALVIIDDATFGRADIDHLRNVAAACTFLIARETPELTEGRSVALTGLPDDAVRALLERRLGRSLSDDELVAALDVSKAVEGNPLYLIQAAALVGRGRITFAELARIASGGPQSLGGYAVDALTPDERSLLATLGGLGPAPVGQDALAGITGQPSARSALQNLAERGLVQPHSPTYTLGANVQTTLSGAPERQTLDQVLRWSATPMDQHELLEAAPVIQHAIADATAARRWQDVITLARRLDAALGASGRWGAWKSVLEQALVAARQLGDPAQMGWALHQLGSRSLGLEDYKGARDLLTKALKARQSVNDAAGAEATAHNLRTLEALEGGTAPPGRGHPKNGGPKSGGSTPWGLIAGATIAVLIAATGGVAYATQSPFISQLLSTASPGPSSSHATSSPSAQVPAAPTIDRAVPSTLPQGSTVKIDFSGSGFANNMQIDLGPSLQIVSSAVHSSTDLTVTVNVASDAAPGPRAVSLTTRDGQKATCAACLTIVPTPFIKVVSPGSAGQGAAVQLVIGGANLSAKTQVSISGSGVKVGAVRVEGEAAVLQVSITVDPTAPTGARDVTVTDGGASTCAGCFTVTPAPIATTPNPPYVVYYWVQSTFKLFGSAFTPQTSLQFPQGYMTVNAVNFVSPTEIDVTVTASPPAPTPPLPDYRSFIVTNPDGGNSQCTNCVDATYQLQ